MAAKRSRNEKENPESQESLTDVFGDIGLSDNDGGSLPQKSKSL